MSDEHLLSREMTGEMADAVAPTERAPSVAPSAPPRGAALSVLWWRETDAGDKDDEQKPETD